MEKLNIPLIIKASLLDTEVEVPDFIIENYPPINRLINDGKLIINSRSLSIISEMIGPENIQSLVKKSLDKNHYLLTDKSIEPETTLSEVKMPEIEIDERGVSSKGFDLSGLSGGFSVKQKESDVEKTVETVVDEPSVEDVLEVEDKPLKEDSFNLFDGIIKPKVNDKDDSKNKDLKHSLSVLTAAANNELDKNDNALIKRILAYKGISQKLVANCAFKPTKTGDMLLKSGGYDIGLVERNASCLRKLYKSDSEVLGDVYHQYSEEFLKSLMEYFSGVKDADILLVQPKSLSFVKSLSETDNSVYALPYSELTGKLIDTVAPQASLIQSNSAMEFDYLIGTIQKDDRIETQKEYEYSYLRADEKEVLRALEGLKKGFKSILMVPSELSNGARGVFHQTLLKESTVDKVVRLPKNLLGESIDVYFIEKTPDKKPGLSIEERIKSINGISLDEEGASLSRISSEIGFNDYIHYQVKTYESDSQDLQKVMPGYFSQASQEKETIVSSKFKEDSYYQKDGDVFQCQNGLLVEVKQGIASNRVKQFIVLSKSLEQYYKAQKKGSGVESARKTLNAEYDLFVKKFGYLSLRKNERPLEADPRYNRIIALEHIFKDKETGEQIVEKSSIFEKPVFSEGSVYSDRSNIALTANQYFEVNGDYNLERIASLVKSTPKMVEEYLIDNQVAFKVGENLVHKDIYLTGNIGQKLKEAVEASQFDGGYHRNIQALKEVMPSKIDFEEIYFSIGSHWMPKEVINGFLNNEFKSQKEIDVQQNPLNLTWAFSPEHESYLRINKLFSTRYSFEGKTGLDVLTVALNGLSTNITNKGSVDTEKTELFKQKVQQIQSDFKDYILRTPESRELVERIYNDLFNSYRKCEFNSQLTSLPGMNDAVKLRPHQVNASQMSVHNGNALYAHDAGSGKTFTQILTALLRSKQSNEHGNSLIAVPNHMPRQMLREAMFLFPEMNILTITGDMIKSPEKLIKKVRDYKWDAIIVKHSDLNRIGVPVEFERTQLVSEIEKLNAMVGYYSKNQKISKDFVLSLKKLEKQLAELDENFEGRKSDIEVNLDTLDIGTIIVDEAHNFKNLEIRNPTGNMIDTINGSIRASTLKNMVDFVYKRNGKEEGIVFATGTPISNSLLELFNIQQYLQPELMKKLGLQSIKSWTDTFLEIKTDYEPDATGRNFIPRNRYVLKNIPELMNILSTVMNVVTIADAGIEVPDHKMIYENVHMDKEQQKIANLLVERMEKIMKKQVSNKVDNKLKIIADGRKLALSPNMVTDPDGLPALSTKLSKVCDNAYKEYVQSEEILGTQLIFCDLGTPSGFPNGDSVYDIIKDGLIERGVKPEEIAFIHDAKKDADKDRLFADVRSGAVRFLIGSTAKMGEGTNVQERIVASHDVDPPWRPKDVIQRRRRTIRQGNMNDLVSMYVYTTDKSFDGYVWATLDAKNKTFGHIMSGKVTQRSFELDIDPSFSETYALVTGNPLLIERSKIENDLITLNAKKSNIERQVNNLNKAIHLSNSTIEENSEVLNRMESVQYKNYPDGWTINGVQSSRQDVLKKRDESIFYNGMQVRFDNDKKRWNMGEFSFKRPADIEKQMNFDYAVRVKSLREANEELVSDVKLLTGELNSIDESIYDEEIDKLVETIDEIDREINMFNDSSQGERDRNMR